MEEGETWRRWQGGSGRPGALARTVAAVEVATAGVEERGKVLRPSQKRSGTRQRRPRRALTREREGMSQRLASRGRRGKQGATSGQKLGPVAEIEKEGDSLTRVGQLPLHRTAVAWT